MSISHTDPAAVVDRLRAELDGRVIIPGDERYERARTIFYGGFDRRPAAVVQAADASEVASVVRMAAATGTELAVRSGGHSPAGHGLTDGGIVLDLSTLRSLDIDIAGRTAWAGAGLTTGEYTAAAGEHGLATGFGDTGSVGLGGITLAGGIGFLVRKHGLTIDNLLAAEVVTADGSILTTDAETHPDLFWAIRGGGGNFGVATRFRFRLHEVPGIVGGILILPAAADVVTSFVELADAAPEELSTIVNVMLAPPIPFVPDEYHGKPIVFGLLAYAGETGKGESVIDPFRRLATPITDLVRPMTYPEIFLPDEEEFHPVAIGRTMFVDGLEPTAAGEIIDRVASSTADMAVTQIRVLGGAMGLVPVEATAFAHRHRQMMINVAAATMTAADITEHQGWVDGLAGELGRGEAAYVGFLGDEGQDRVRAAYPDATWDRLTAVKAAYDPHNLFRVNHNIPPMR